MRISRPIAAMSCWAALVAGGATQTRASVPPGVVAPPEAIDPTTWVTTDD